MTFEQFFNSETKSKLIKFFLYNSTKFFKIKDIASLMQMPSRSLKTPLKQLHFSGFLKSKGPSTFSVSYKFPYLNDLKHLVLQFPPVSDMQLVKAVQKVGKIKLFLISGVLINEEKSRTDMLIVGEKTSEKRAEKFLHDVEASIGQEMRYALLTTEEFKYRKNMFDRFILDILELPHRKLINKLKV